jgi:hypothetical protein
MICHVDDRKLATSVLSRERRSADLWRLVVAEWARLRPADVPRVDLAPRSFDAYRRHLDGARERELSVGGCETDWELEDASRSRMIFIDGPAPDFEWPKHRHTKHEHFLWIEPGQARRFARATGATVVVAIYDRAHESRWRRYADTYLRIGRPIGGKHPRVGEVDVVVSSAMHLTAGAFIAWWQQPGDRIHLVEAESDE